MSTGLTNPELGEIVWVYCDDLCVSLDAATWLKTTRHLRELGWKVTLITGSASTERSGPTEIDGVTVHAIRIPRVWFLGQALFHAQVCRLIVQRLGTIDAVIFHEMSAAWLLPLRLLGRRAPRLVMDTRTLFMADPSTISLKDHIRAAYMTAMQWLSNRLADGRLCITPAMAEACRVPADKLWGIWPSAVDPEAFRIGTASRKWPGDDYPIEIIYVGCLHKERHLSNLCQAINRVNSKARRFRLTMIGEGSERRELEQYAQQSHGSIQVWPPVPHAQVPQRLAAAHVGVLPFPNEKKFNVSSPIKLFEYAASGLPILATRIRCHTDVLDACPYVHWAQSSRVEDLSAALERIWTNRLSLPEQGSQATKDAAHWTWAASARRLSDALKAHLPGDHPPLRPTHRTSRGLARLRSWRPPARKPQGLIPGHTDGPSHAGG